MHEISFEVFNSCFSTIMNVIYTFVSVLLGLQNVAFELSVNICTCIELLYCWQILCTLMHQILCSILVIINVYTDKIKIRISETLSLLLFQVAIKISVIFYY